MEKIVVICFSTEMGINPFIRSIKDESEIIGFVKSLVSYIYEDDGPVYVEVYRECGGDLLSFYRCFTFDGESLKHCLCLKPSFRFMKKFVEDESFKSLDL